MGRSRSPESGADGEREKATRDKEKSRREDGSREREHERKERKERHRDKAAQRDKVCVYDAVRACVCECGVCQCVCANVCA